MENITLKYNVIQSLGYLTCRVPQDVFRIVEQEVNKLIKTNFKNATSYSSSLSGVIEHEYILYECEDIINKFFKQVIPEYWRFNNELDKAKLLYRISRSKNSKPDLWCNLQKKYEYNPLHNHAGDLSFVLYVKIPYDLNKEKTEPHVVNHNSLSLPAFTFMYPSLKPTVSSTGKEIYVESHPIVVDRSYEGVMLIFPAWLQHMVTPFYTSDDYRISVSGNIKLVDNG